MTAAQVLALSASYLIGAIPIGLLAGLAKGVDVRTVGSGNIGATNVMRAVGVRIGVGVFIADVLKGACGVLACAAVGVEGWMLGMGGMLTVIGHCFSPYLAFKGGKGVAATLGVLLALHPLPALACLALWVIVVAVTRYVSLGSVLAVAAVPVAFYVGAPSRDAGLILVVTAIATLVVGRHHENVERLLKGTENRVGEKGNGAGRTESGQAPRPAEDGDDEDGGP